MQCLQHTSHVLELHFIRLIGEVYCCIFNFELSLIGSQLLVDDVDAVGLTLLLELLEFIFRCFHLLVVL